MKKRDSVDKPIINTPPSDLDQKKITTIDQGHSFLYLNKEAVKQVGLVKSKEFYGDAVRQLPICCVDVFLYNPFNKTYLLVLRKDPPAKNVWWIPGGRLYKGESFFDCSIRKCKEEIGLDVTPVKNIDAIATIFPDSMWETQTHTVNFVVLAKLNAETKLALDQTCQTINGNR